MSKLLVGGPVLVVVGDTACQVAGCAGSRGWQALGDARRLYGPAPAPGEWSSTGGLATGREAVAQSSSSGSAAQNWSGAGSSTYVRTSGVQVQALDAVMGADQGTARGSARPLTRHVTAAVGWTAWSALPAPVWRRWRRAPTPRSRTANRLRRVTSRPVV